MRKKHGSVPTLHTCSGPESRNEQKHWHSKCHYKRNSGSPLRGYEQPHSMGEGLRSNGRPTPDTPAWRPRPTRRATGAPDAACKQPHRLHHHRASSIAEPIPRLEATQRATQQCQPDAAANAAKSGPAVMTVAGAREQRSRRQPSSRPIRGQQENPLSRREDNAPVIRSSNGSRTRNGCPANYSPRRTNSAAGQAASLAGAAGDASPSS
jgi:hypothetical protein